MFKKFYKLFKLHIRKNPKIKTGTLLVCQTRLDQCLETFWDTWNACMCEVGQAVLCIGEAVPCPDPRPLSAGRAVNHTLGAMLTQPLSGQATGSPT